MKKLYNIHKLLPVQILLIIVAVLGLHALVTGSLYAAEESTAPVASITPLDSSLQLEWMPVSGAQKYRWRIKQENGIWSGYTQVSSTTHAITIEELINDTPYTVSVSTQKNNIWRNEWTELTASPTDLNDEPLDGPLTLGAPEIEMTAPASSLVITDYAEQTGLKSTPLVASTFGKPCVADINRDGLSDVLWSEHKSDILNMYYGNSNGTFTLKTNTGLTKHDNHGCAVADFDKDGDLDIFGPSGACNGTCFKRDKLWLQKPSGSFEPKESLLGTFTKDRSREVTILDVNNDGWTDILIAASAKPPGTSHHRMMINRGVGNTGNWLGFTETPMGIERANGNSVCAEAADLDGDGYVEIIICEDNRAWIYKNNAGTSFTNYETNVSMADINGVSFSDITNDGIPDLLIARTNALEVYENSNGNFNTMLLSQELIFGYEVVTPDIDGDDTLDIVVVQALSRQHPASNGAHMLFLNRPGAFERVEIPQPTRGAGDKAVVLQNFKGTNQDAVLIGNGGQWDTKGHRQVLAQQGL